MTAAFKCDECGALDLFECGCGLDLDAEQAAMPEPTPVTIAQFELDMCRVAIEDLWRAVFGDSKPVPSRTSVAARKLLGPVMCVDWSNCRPQPPKPPRRLPLGVVRDEE